MEWVNVVKRRKKSMQGNIPHFYHWLTRLQRKRHEHTKQWLEKYCAWEELPHEVKEYMKRYYLDSLSPTQQRSGWNPRGIDGIKLNWENLDFTVDEQVYNDWRANETNPSRKAAWTETHRMNGIYRTIMEELKNCHSHSTGQGGNLYSYLSRYYTSGGWKPSPAAANLLAYSQHKAKTPYGQLNPNSGAWNK